MAPEFIPAPLPAGYIRGAAGVSVSDRHVARAVVAVWLVLLGVLGTVLAIEAGRQNARDHSLTNSGVPVTVTVTGCVGLASGTGVTNTGFICSGTFVLGGHRYTDAIGGTKALFSRGDAVRAVTDPRNPSILSTPSAVATASASLTAFVPAALVFLCLFASAAYGAVRFGGRGSRREN